MRFNEAVKLLPGDGATVESRVEAFRKSYPSETLIHLDRPWMPRPLPSLVKDGMEKAVGHAAAPFTDHMDSPAFGYRSVRAALTEQMKRVGVEFSENEIFLFPGAKSAHSAFSHLFGRENDVLLCDPGEPSLTALHRSAGRNLRFLRALPENGFTPMPDERADLIYLSSPNLITGAAYTAGALAEWVRRANEWESILVFDASYAPFCSGRPRSVYEIPGARDCAVEIFSYARAFGNPELKLASIVIPATLVCHGERIHPLFAAGAAAVSSPPDFVSQVGGERLTSEEARDAREDALAETLSVGRVLSGGLTRMGIPHVGEGDSPWIWAQCPGEMNAWQFFDLLLREARVVVTPGSLFGYGGERFVRLSAYVSSEEAREAVEGIARAVKIWRSAPPEPGTADILKG